MDVDNLQKPERRKSRRRRLPPPARLAWPGDAIGREESNDDSLNATEVISESSQIYSKSYVGITQSNRKRGAKATKKSRRSRLNDTSTNDNDDGGSSHRSNNTRMSTCTVNDTMLWVDKYQPSSSKSICVAPKKVKEVAEWLQSSIFALSSFSSSSYKAQYASNKLLILVGSPGIGKSTMLRVLAKELNLLILEWNDVSNEYVSHTSNGATSRSSRGLGGLSYESQLSSFEDFLNSAAFQYQRCVSLNAECNDSDNNNHDRNTSGLSSVVLIDETPNLHTKESEIEFRNVMSQYLHKTQTPTVFIFSDVFEGRHKPEDLERYFDPALLHNPSLCTILQINPVTKAKMKSCLKDILKQEGIKSKGTGRGTRKDGNDDLLEILHMQSGGDLRHAIMNLQFQLNCRGQHGSASGGAGRKMGKDKDAGLVDNMNIHHQRDTKLSTFHALGKLLYAKRVEDAKEGVGAANNDFVSYHDCAWNKDRRAPLQFDPEKVLEQGDIGINGALSFLHYHSIDFFSDISDLSIAFDRFSDGAHFMKDSYRASNDSSYPQDYVSSLVSRSVGDANKHPVPSKFRQLSAPMIYEVMRKKRENQVKIEQVCKRLSYRGHHYAMHANNTSSRFTTDDLPYLKQIIPEEVSRFQGKIYQYSSNFVSLDGCGEVGGDENSSNNLAAEREDQNAVLANDDIIDSSSDSEIETDDTDEGLSIQQSNVVTSSQRSSVVSQDSPPLLDNHDVGKRSHEDIIVID